MRRLSTLLIGLLLLGLTVAAEAQETLEDARERRAAIQEEAAANAGEIDVLAAEDADIVAALAEIDAWVAIQEAELDAAEQQLVAANEARDEAQAQADEIDAYIHRLEAELAQQSINTYIEGFRPPALLETNDVNAVPILQFVLDEATGRTADTSDLLRLAGEQQRELLAEAQAAGETAEALQNEIGSRLDDLADSRADQEAIRAEIDDRIATLEADAAVLAAEDDRIAAFIVAEEARIAEAARQAEAARLAAEAEAQRPQPEATPAPATTPEPSNDADPAVTPAADATPTPAPSQPTPVPTATPAPQPPPDNGAPQFIWPVGGGVYSSFGNRVHPVYGTIRFHAGIDLGSTTGTPIGAAASGTVLSAGWRDGYGNTVIIDHGGGFTTLYAHMSSISTSTGASVSAGTIVGAIGSTGLSTGPHLHFEVRINGAAVDPLIYLP